MIRKIFLITFCATMLILCGCAVEGGVERDKEFSEKSVGYGMVILKDNVTGVEYITICYGHGFVAITPRYNKDGTLFTGK